MEKVIRTWYENKIISPEHTSLEIKQIYVWVVSSDNMVAIVTKSNGNSQFPGGHPEEKEKALETAVREVNEEAGLDISSYISELTQFGYYVIEENGERYIQLRFLLILPNNANVFPLSVNERSDEQRPVDKALWVELLNLPKYIPWTKNLEEYNNVIDLVIGK